jgi:hypothetical protein
MEVRKIEVVCDLAPSNLVSAWQRLSGMSIFSECC